MNQLPQELIDDICGYLPAEDLCNTYYVSTKFRKAAEEHAEKHRKHRSWEYNIVELDEKTTAEQKRQFIDRYSGFRLRYLNEVRFSTHFPVWNTFKPPERYASGYLETAQHRREIDKIYTEQVLDLFTTLKIVEDRAGERNRGKFKLTVITTSEPRSGYERCRHWEKRFWRIHLMNPETLPDLMSVTSLELTDEGSETKIDCRILIDLTIRCPNLEELEWHMALEEWNRSYREELAKLFPDEYDGPRRDTRHDLRKAITSTNIPKSLRTVDLDFFSRYSNHAADNVHQWTPTPDLVSPALKDPFSTSIRMLSYHLRTLTLQVQADDTLFWPEDGCTPTWPNLQDLFVMFHMISPSGAWYFEGPRGEGRETIGHEVNESSYPPLEHTEDCEYDDSEAEDDVNRSFEDYNSFAFRISPNEKVLKPFLTSLAKAAANMPALRRLVAWSPLRWEIDCGEDEEREVFDYFDLPYDLYRYPIKLEWGFAYSGPRFGWFTENRRAEVCDARQIWWRVGEWRPDAELHSLFQKIGTQEHGEALKEHWEDKKFGRGLVSRGTCLEEWTQGF